MTFRGWFSESPQLGASKAVAHKDTSNIMSSASYTLKIVGLPSTLSREDVLKLLSEIGSVKSLQLDTRRIQSFHDNTKKHHHFRQAHAASGKITLADVQFTNQSKSFNERANTLLHGLLVGYSQVYSVVMHRGGCGW